MLIYLIYVMIANWFESLLHYSVIIYYLTIFFSDLTDMTLQEIQALRQKIGIKRYKKAQARDRFSPFKQLRPHLAIVNITTKWQQTTMSQCQAVSAGCCKASRENTLSNRIDRTLLTKMYFLF